MTVKQKALHHALPIRGQIGFFLALCFVCTGAPVAHADGTALRAVQPSVTNAAATGEASKLRLVDGTGLRRGIYVAGVEITMAAGSHTYWKMPGDAGVPPVFVFDGSENVASATVLFPAPKRITEDGIEALGYTDRVIFPVMVKPKDAGKTATLHVDVRYAVCNKICLPAHGDATLKLEPGGTGASAKPIDTALVGVPVPIAPDEARNLAITPEKGAKKQTWTLAWHGAAPLEDVFADAPEGFYFDTKKTGAGTWRLIASSVVSSPSSKPVPVTLTLARADGSSLAAIEMLDVTAPTQ